MAELKPDISSDKTIKSNYKPHYDEVGVYINSRGSPITFLNNLYMDTFKKVLK